MLWLFDILDSYQETSRLKSNKAMLLSMSHGLSNRVYSRFTLVWRRGRNSGTTQGSSIKRQLLSLPSPFPSSNFFSKLNSRTTLHTRLYSLQSSSSSPLRLLFHHQLLWLKTLRRWNSSCLARLTWARNPKLLLFGEPLLWKKSSNTQSPKESTPYRFPQLKARGFPSRRGAGDFGW